VVALGAAHKYPKPADVASGRACSSSSIGVEDPHNLGAVILTATQPAPTPVSDSRAPCGGLTDVVAKAAAGALEHLPVFAWHLNRALDEIKEVDTRYTVLRREGHGSTTIG